MKEELLNHIREAVVKHGIEADSVHLDYPENLEHGDFSSNLAMANAGKLKMNPLKLAEKIAGEIKKKIPDFIAEVMVAGPGFINFKLKDSFLVKTIVDISKKGHEYGKSKINAGKKILIEYTDPNIFKVFHVGHLMSNAIGESLSRLIEYTGASVTRLCYPSDIGLHIAKSIWAMRKHSADVPDDIAPIWVRTDFLGRMYVEGTSAYENNTESKSDIDSLNKVLYANSDPEVRALYEKGKRWSLEHFDILYRLLGTKFDDFFYESEMVPIGLTIVKKNTGKIFEKSDGAVVFKGEKYGLHTRVFVNSAGLPTYEAKDVGLNMAKFAKYPDTKQSIIVTASEQNDYFKVLLKAISLFNLDSASKTLHIGHGMLRFVSGKMSSRKGNVITGESLIGEIRSMVKKKIHGDEKNNARDPEMKMLKARNSLSEKDIDEISDIVAVAAIKYSILRQSIGSDIIFDSASSISFEGDSGPYLQYSAVRAASVLEKAMEIFSTDDQSVNVFPEKATSLERLLIRFPDIVALAWMEYAPQHIAGYLISLAGAFNGFYASQIIVDKNDRFSPYYITLTSAFLNTMTNGLWTLGIKVPKKM